MKTYAKNISNRKDLVKKLEQLTGQHAVYTFMPKCAYEIGAFTVNKDGTLTVQDDADSSIIERLAADGMIGGEIIAEEPTGTVSEAATIARATVSESWDDEWEEDGTEEAEEAFEDSTADPEIEEDASEPEFNAEETEPSEAEDNWDDDETIEEEVSESTAPLKTSISFPLAQHTVQTLMNLICMIHSRGSLISKATGGNFSADKALVDAIGEHEFRSVHELIAYIREWNETNPSLTGISFDNNNVAFDGFGEADADHLQTYTKLAAAMNKMSITQKRVQAKDVDDANEKYAFRIWLIRLGMNGADCKADRKRLMANLSGHTAFRNDEERVRWEAKQKAKRDAQKEENRDAVSE